MRIEQVRTCAERHNPKRHIEIYKMFAEMRFKMIFDVEKMFWIRQPQNYEINKDSIEIITEPNTDLWQRTYYGFRNDNAPVFQMKIKEKFFSFVVKTAFESKQRFDQCGIVSYMDSENWMKASVEYENEEYQRLGSVVTNQGYSDWATTDISSDIKEMWYRFSRRKYDFCFEYSIDGKNFKQMRICHFCKGADEIMFGIYAASPEKSSFKAVFTEMELSDCVWKAHESV